MKKKKIITLALVSLIAVISITSATLAYFTDTKKAVNTFTMGNVKIVLDETDVTDPDGDRVTKNEYEVYPGAVITKDPIVHNTGENGCYVRAKVNVENWMNTCSAYFPDFKVTYPNDGYEKSLLLLVDALGEGWSIVGVDAGTPFVTGNLSAVFILKYDGVLASDADTTAMFTEVTIPAGITNGNTMGTITVTAEAIQADGFTSWEDAFAAFDGE